jgi:hypothetical protein
MGAHTERDHPAVCASRQYSALQGLKGGIAPLNVEIGEAALLALSR